ncbi:hypothetical protein BKA66DRAFT_478927 [Pyrenochaeta sp. MPI-SDFR-AT-0127]|nr:hypothetical protein BKA66DRAFT_478927 [Pyrenochaeta sp. MPI-SDFR-AT-0127]
MTQSYVIELEPATVDTTCPRSAANNKDDETKPQQQRQGACNQVTATATVRVTEVATVTVIQGPDGLPTSITTATSSPVVTQLTPSMHYTVELSSGVVLALLALVFVGSLVWLATFWRGKSAFRTLCLLWPTFVPSALIFWLMPQLQALDHGWAPSHVLLYMVAATSLLAACLLVADVTGVTTLIYELVRVLSRWRNAEGWRFGWGWTREKPHARPRDTLEGADQVLGYKLAAPGDVLPGLKPQYGRYM